MTGRRPAAAMTGSGLAAGDSETLVLVPAGVEPGAAT